MFRMFLRKETAGMERHPTRGEVDRHAMFQSPLIVNTTRGKCCDLFGVGLLKEC